MKLSSLIRLDPSVPTQRDSPQSEGAFPKTGCGNPTHLHNINNAAMHTVDDSVGVS